MNPSPCLNCGNPTGADAEYCDVCAVPAMEVAEREGLCDCGRFTNHHEHCDWCECGNCFIDRDLHPDSYATEIAA